MLGIVYSEPQMKQLHEIKEDYISHQVLYFQ